MPNNRQLNQYVTALVREEKERYSSDEAKEALLRIFEVKIADAASKPLYGTQMRYDRMSLGCSIWNTLQLVPDAFGDDFPRYHERYDELVRRLLTDVFAQR